MAHVDLSTLKNKKQDTPNDNAEDPLEGLTDDEIAALADKASDDLGEAVRTAFTVVVHRDGRISIDTSVDGKKYRPDHVPSLDEMYSAAALVQSDIQVTKTSQASAMAFDHLMMQKTQMMQAQQQDAALRSQLRI
jgi:hypothetical protein